MAACATAAGLARGDVLLGPMARPSLSFMAACGALIVQDPWLGAIMRKAIMLMVGCATTLALAAVANGSAAVFVGTAGRVAMTFVTCVGHNRWGEPAGNLRACTHIVSWVEPAGIWSSRLALV